MPGNTVKTDGNIDVYTHDIYAYAEEYIYQELDGNKDKVPDYFVDMILYINDRIPKISTDQIELLDSIFSVYARLCTRYRVLPTLECFSFLVGIERSTFSSWISGEYRSSSLHHPTAKKWLDYCRSATVNRLHQKGGTDANLIFIAKAAYGMAETAPVQTINHAQAVIAASELPVLSSSKPAMPALELSDNS